MMPGEGDVAPEFTLLSDTGERVSLNDFLGKKVVLYFYPKDGTLDVRRRRGSSGISPGNLRGRKRWS